MTTPYVEYSYADGTANTLRPTGLKYPNGRELTYDYDAADSPADLLSRVYQIKDGADVLAQYDYLGVGAIITAEYPGPEVAYDLTYEGTVDDPLAGCLDSLGRITQVPWVKDDAIIAGATYQYDRVANRTQMQPLGYTATADRQRYQYDPLYRLTNLARGETDEAQGAERWSLDATGNWKEYDVLDAADAAKNLSQRRTANRVNELTAINNFYGANWAPPQYDPAGNMTQLPQPNSPSDSYTATYDAWNRLVKLQDGATIVEEYAYDAKTRRVTQAASGTTRHAYFTPGWRRIEERLDTTDVADRQFVWGQRYIDDLVLRDTADRYYNLQDGNWNTVAVIDDEGEVQQRFRYSAYGKLTVLEPDGGISDGDDTLRWEIGFGGYYFSIDSGISNARYRDYIAVIGRWLSADPAQYGDGLNLYQYVTSHPLRSPDPFGLGIGGNEAYEIMRAFLSQFSNSKGIAFHRFRDIKRSDRECADRILAVAFDQFNQNTFTDLGMKLVFIGVESLPNTPLKVAIPVELYQQWYAGEINQEGVAKLVQKAVFDAASDAGLPANKTVEEVMEGLKPSIEKLVQQIISESLPWSYAYEINDPAQMGFGDSVRCTMQIRASDSRWRIDGTCAYTCRTTRDDARVPVYCCCGPQRNLTIYGAKGSRNAHRATAFGGTAELIISPR